MSTPVPPGPCPCGTGRTYAACCGALIARERPAATAEELMRSRFTAHVVGAFEHLHRTCEETAAEPYEPEPEGERRAWSRLVIHAHAPGVRPDTAFVDFTAYYREGDAEHPLHEKGEFRRVNGAWLYVRPVRQGPAPIRATAARVGRNDPCPCGSGKKYKQCCGR